MATTDDASDNFSEAHDPPANRNEPKRYGVDEGTGTLLTDKEFAVTAVKLFTDQLKRPDVQRELESWKINRLRRDGFANVWLQKQENLQQWKAYVPPGLEQQAPAFNKAADLCRKFPNVLYVDPPAPEPVPATGEEEDIEAAEFAERVLIDVQGEGHLDDLMLQREAQDHACTYDRAYIHYWVDPKGRQVPLQIQAAEGAVSAEQPFHVQQVDPMGQPVMVEAPPPYPLRYVRADGSLTDVRAEAVLQWVPRLRGRALKPHNVRPLPATAKDVWDAEGMVIGEWRPWAELVEQYPDLAKLDEDVRTQLSNYRPQGNWKRLWPEGVPQNSESMHLDDRLYFYVCVYYRAGGRYPNGAVVEALAPDHPLGRSTWEGKRPDGVTELLDIPITEMRQSPDGGLMSILGPANEHRMAQWAYALQWVDDWNNRATFIPTTSTLRPEDLEERDGKYFKVSPGGAPLTEDVDPLPPTVMDLLELIGADMDSQSNLGPTAQGVDDPNVKSGTHAREARSAALVLMSGAQQHAERCYVRGCRIQLQLLATRFHVPQLIGWVGEDGQYRQQYWSASDLKGTKDVRLKKGSLSLQSPQAKAQEAIYYSQIGVNTQTGAGVVGPDELRDILEDRLGGVLGLRDNPIRQRVKRQVAAWRDGPPEGYQDPGMAPPQVVGVGPDGSPQMGPPQAIPAPQAQAIFTPIPDDETPDAARIRFEELRRCMATLKYAGKPLGWRAAFDAEYQRMRRAAGVQTLAEQQAAMAAQQQAQAQAEAAKSQQEHQRGMEKDQQAHRQGMAQQAAAAQQKTAGALATQAAKAPEGVVV